MAVESVKTAALTPEQAVEFDALLGRAARAQQTAEQLSQQQVDRFCRAVCWEISNKHAFGRLVDMSIAEGGLGDPVTRMEGRLRLRGILRDVLRQKSVGVVEELPERGLVKYAKPVGTIVSILPAQSPALSPGGQALFAVKARDSIIFSPHPRTRGTTWRLCELIRRALQAQGAPEDLVQCVKNPSRQMAEALQNRADLVICSAGPGRMRSAFRSGTPAYGAGTGNATMIFDETADVIDACHNTMLSKTLDFGSGGSADGNLIVHESIFSGVRRQLEVEGGYFANEEQKGLLRRVMWDENGKRRAATVGIAAPKLAEAAGFSIPEDRKFIFVAGGEISPDNPFSQQKLTTLLTLFRYEGEFENALNLMRAICGSGGKGHSVGIYSYNDEHIHRLGLAAPVARIMVRQPQSKANAGSATNGMPMTTVLGCGTWGGNIVSGNVCLEHYLNTTWVSRPIPEDMPAPEELFGEFYDPALDL